MSQTKAPMELDTPWEESDSTQRQEAGFTDLVEATGSAHTRSIWHFLRHLAEMVIVMMIGMCVGVGIFAAVLGVSYKQLTRQDPGAALLVMAVSMALPMVAWMFFRGHTWRNSLEMGAVMLLPVVPFLACVWAHVFDKAPNGPYMMVSTVAMVALMLYRWEVYSSHPARRLRAVPAGKGRS